MATEEIVEGMLRSITDWAIARDDIFAAALVGSWAKGTARSDSDIDVMFVVCDPLQLRLERSWSAEIDWPSLYRIDRQMVKDYGVVWSRHLSLSDSEGSGNVLVELSFGSSDWVAFNPVDPGTKRVVSDGMRVLYEQDHLLSDLIDAVGEG